MWSVLSIAEHDDDRTEYYQVHTFFASARLHARALTNGFLVSRLELIQSKNC